MSDRSRWQPVSPWRQGGAPDFGGGTAAEAGLRIEPVEVAALATIIVRTGQGAALERRLGEHLGCDVPGVGRVASGKIVDLVWSAPGQWLAVAAAAGALDGLADTLAGIAAVTDQSDSRAILRLSGPRARDVLAKGFAIDLHPSVFPPGSAAITKVAHLSVQIWQVGSEPAFLVAVPRSYAGTFRAWLAAACGASL